jgi:hypothetical protein
VLGIPILLKTKHILAGQIALADENEAGIRGEETEMAGKDLRT